MSYREFGVRRDLSLYHENRYFDSYNVSTSGAYKTSTIGDQQMSLYVNHPRYIDKVELQMSAVIKWMLKCDVKKSG